DHFIDKLIPPDSPGDRDHLHVGRHSRDEVRCVELSQLGFAAAASQDGHMIYIGVLDHRIERVVSAAGLKFMRIWSSHNRTKSVSAPVPASFCACLLMAFLR